MGSSKRVIQLKVDFLQSQYFLYYTLCTCRWESKNAYHNVTGNWQDLIGNGNNLCNIWSNWNKFELRKVSFRWERLDLYHVLRHSSNVTSSCCEDESQWGLASTYHISFQPTRPESTFTLHSEPAQSSQMTHFWHKTRPKGSWLLGCSHARIRDSVLIERPKVRHRK